MAKAKKPAKKPVALLGKPKSGDRPYTKAKLVAHLATAVSGKGFGEISKKQAAAFVDVLTDTILAYAPVGAPIPGVGKVVVRETKARPAREGINPKTGEKIQIPAKPKGKKLAFRFAREAKDLFKK